MSPGDEYYHFTTARRRQVYSSRPMTDWVEAPSKVDAALHYRGVIHFLHGGNSYQYISVPSEVSFKHFLTFL